MITTDLILLFTWWLTFFVVSITMLPVTAMLFRSFYDRGYIFSKSLGLIFITYLALVLGVLHILPFSAPSLYFLILVLAGINYGGLWYVKKSKNTKTIIATFVRTHWKTILFQELLFLGGIYFLAYIRSFSPDIHGLEKFMDFGFMNSIARSEYFPPKDMWLTPFSINYYYFGHFTGAVLMKLTQIPGNLAYNLILASVFALSFVGSFSLGSNLFELIHTSGKLNLLRRIISGFLTALLVTIGGNLHTLYAFFKPYENEKPVAIWELPFLPLSFPNSYWYPNATRFIFNTIHEFPMYSWVVADLHGHVFDIPFVITVMALLLSFLRNEHEPKTHNVHQQNTKNMFLKLYYSHPFRPGIIILLGFLLSVLYMTNAWDGLIYFLLSGLFILYVHILHYKHKEKLSFLFHKDFLLPLIFSGSLLFFCFYVLFLTPFNLFFKPFVSGVGVLCAPEFLVDRGSIGPFLFEADHCQRSPWWQLLMLYGFFYFFIFSFLGFLTKVKRVRISDTYVLLLIILGTLLILIPEFIYVKDIYPAHYRANTMFKLVFQSFIILSIASSYIISRIASAMRNKQLKIHDRVLGSIFILISLIVVGVVMLYPVQAINSYYGNLKAYSGLDGTKYLDTLYPSDYLAINWLNDHVVGQPVILEAQGDSYTDFARVSANTGLPTVLGWTVHEWLWRNNYDIPNPPADPKEVYEVPAPRIAEIQTLYESDDITETKRLVTKYAIEYIFVGVLEKQKYPQLNETKWSVLGTQVYRSGTTAIYKVK